MYKVAVITLSDRAYQEVYTDMSGEYLVDYFNDESFELLAYQMIDDDANKLEEIIGMLKDYVDIIITTGGTGLCSRDITVDVVEKVMDYEIRGMSAALHQFSLTKTTGAMFSRALCAVVDSTMIITMPGSLKAVQEISEYFKPHLCHGLGHLTGEDNSH